MKTAEILKELSISTSGFADPLVARGTPFGIAMVAAPS